PPGKIADDAGRGGRLDHLAVAAARPGVVHRLVARRAGLRPDKSIRAIDALRLARARAARRRERGHAERRDEQELVSHRRRPRLTLRKHIAAVNVLGCRGRWAEAFA